MPIYEYKCTICGERLEVEQSIKDDTLTTLPGDDHEHTLKKVFHPVGIAFKGEGFYKNDSRGKTKSSVPAPASDTAGSTSSDSPTTSTTPSGDSGATKESTSSAATTTSSTSD